MTPRIARPHPAEIRNRDALTDRLLTELYRMARDAGATKRQMLGFVAKWQPLMWRQLCLNVGKAPCSVDTQRAVLAGLSAAALVEDLARVS